MFSSIFKRIEIQRARNLPKLHHLIRKFVVVHLIVVVVVVIVIEAAEHQAE